VDSKHWLSPEFHIPFEFNHLGLDMVNLSVATLAGVSLFALVSNAHLAAWHEAMWCLNVCTLAQAEVSH